MTLSAMKYMTRPCLNHALTLFSVEAKYILKPEKTNYLPQTSQCEPVPPPESVGLEISCVWDVYNCLQSEDET